MVLTASVKIVSETCTLSSIRDNSTEQESSLILESVHVSETILQGRRLCYERECF